MTEQTVKFIPMLYSAIGTNAYYLHDCKTVEHRPAYAACLRKVQDFQRNIGASSSANACRSAMRNGTCQAVHMRKEEELAGRALYYVDRNTLARDVIATMETTPTSYVRPSAKDQKPRAVEPIITADGYAAAINNALKELPPAQPQPIAQAPSVAKAGMSMVEIAQAAMARAAL